MGDTVYVFDETQGKHAPRICAIEEAFGTGSKVVRDPLGRIWSRREWTIVSYRVKGITEGDDGAHVDLAISKMLHRRNRQ